MNLIKQINEETSKQTAKIEAEYHQAWKDDNEEKMEEIEQKAWKMGNRAANKKNSSPHDNPFDDTSKEKSAKQLNIAWHGGYFSK